MLTEDLAEAGGLLALNTEAVPAAAGYMTPDPDLISSTQPIPDHIVSGVSVSASASKSSIQRFVITEKAPTRAFSWLKAATTAFTFKTLLRHYAKRALTPWSLNVKLGPRRNYHKGRAAIRHYANQTARPL